jgi:hypothetical protein
MYRKIHITHVSYGWYATVPTAVCGVDTNWKGCGMIYCIAVALFISLPNLPSDNLSDAEVQ